jgi:hypothetical protein
MSLLNLNNPPRRKGAGLPMNALLTKFHANTVTNRDLRSRALHGFPFSFGLAFEEPTVSFWRSFWEPAGAG